MSVYKIFPQANLIREWDKLLKLTREEVVSLYEQWKQIHEENSATHRRMYEEKHNKLNEIADFMKAQGVDVYKYSKTKFFPKKVGYLAWFQKNVVDEVSKQYPEYNRQMPTVHMETKVVDGISLYNNQSPTNLVELYDRIIWQYNSELKKKQKTDKLLIKSIEYASLHNIDVEDLAPKDIIQEVEQYAKQEYLEKEVPAGTEVHLKQECSGCDTYIMGEDRCTCGNRRISIAVEGNLLEGFYHYPEPY